jgi:hypothetical protein
MKRTYPLFVFDRNRRSRDEWSQFDFVTCLDRQFGFVARAVLMRREAFDEAVADAEKVEGYEMAHEARLLKSGMAGIVITVLEFMHDFEMNAEARGRIRSLLKKAMDRYLYAEVQTAPTDTGYSVENQIQVLEDIAKDLTAGYARMSAHMGESLAKHYVGCVERAIASLVTLKKIVN